MTPTVFLGLAVVALGVLQLWQRRRIARWSAVWARRNGKLGGLFAGEESPGMVAGVGATFIILGIGTVVYALMSGK